MALSKCVTMREFRELQNYASTFVSTKTIEDFKEKMVPRMEKCENSVSSYRKDNDDMKYCIRTFDEQLCNKSSK